ncbi:MAG: extracellular solute-binding protein [Clostridia bacterium]|nr:extracellular solute-binding protein [Clostridia bacterium]
MMRDSILKLLLAVVLSLATVFLTACSTGADKSINSEKYNVDAEGNPLKEVTLTFGFAGNQSGDSNVLAELEKRAKKDLNVRLDFKWSNKTTGIYDTVKAAMNSDTRCDAFCTETGLSYKDLQKLEKDGFVLDLKELFPKVAPNYYKKFTKEDLNSITVNNKLLAVPNYLPNANLRCAIVREDLMNKYNIPEIKSFDDLEVFLRTVKEKEPGIIPLYMDNTQSGPRGFYYDTALNLFAESMGYVVLDNELGLVYRWDDPETKVVAWEQTPEYCKAIETLKRWKDCGYYSEEKVYYIPGRYAAHIGNGAYELLFTSLEVDYSYTDHSFRFYPLYSGKPTQKGYSFDGGVVISSRSENPERVLAFIEWLQSNQENYDLLMYGIQGKNYVLYGDQFDIPKNAGMEDYAYWNWIGSGTFRNSDLERTRVPNAPDFGKRYKDTLKGNVRYAPHTGLRIDTQLVEDIAQYRRSTFTSIEERIRMGQFTGNDIERYIDDQKKKGVDKLVSIVQKQLDDWRKENQNKD